MGGGGGGGHGAHLPHVLVGAQVQQRHRHVITGRHLGTWRGREKITTRGLEGS